MRLINRIPEEATILDLANDPDFQEGGEMPLLYRDERYELELGWLHACSNSK